MKLYLHIGTEKTGSSFIQTSFARNRDLLLRQGIWYPMAGAREKDMLAGRISPGNASNLHNALNNGEELKTRTILKGHQSDLETNSAEKLLLTNENLLEVFSQKGKLEWFQRILSELNIELESIILILRDPVEQALSLYKHRAKSGQLTSLPGWIKNEYHYHTFLDGFKVEATRIGKKLIVRNYSSEGQQLIRIFYEDWMGIEPPVVEAVQQVNPSLTLSELSWLSTLAGHSGQMAQDFYNCMIKIPKQAKSDDKFLKKWARNEIAIFLEGYYHIWDFYNKLLPQSEKLNNQMKLNSSVEDQQEYSFSSKQLEAMAQYVIDQQKFSTLLVHQFKKLKVFLAKAKKGLKTIKK